MSSFNLIIFYPVLCSDYKYTQIYESFRLFEPSDGVKDEEPDDYRSATEESAPKKRIIK